MFSFWKGLLYMVLIPSICKIKAQVENRVVFILGTFRNVSVLQNETVQAVVSRIPSDVAYITLQLHTQHQNATLSYTRMPGVGLSFTAIDSGLLSHLLPGQNSLSWFLLSSGERAVVGTGVILPYTSTDPVPGACKMENNLDIDPNVHLRYNLYETIIHFAPANIGYERGATPTACDIATGSTPRLRLEYDIYQLFLPKNDLSEHSLIASLQDMTNVQSIREYGKLVITVSSEEQTTASFGSIPGQGVIYSVLVRDPLLNTSAAYVPVHTYACSFASTLDGCFTLGKITTNVFFTITGLAGLFVCFFGHRFFKCELFCMGFSFAAFLFFILITGETTLEYNMRLALTAVVGVVGGVVLVISWWRFGSIMACVLVVGLMLGFLLSSTIFFTPLGDLDVFHSDVAFWLTFSCITVTMPLLFIRWPREGNIITCGVVGAYAAVLAVSSYVNTSVSYITLNILKRLLNNNFNSTFTNVSFRDIDYVMITMWAVLGVTGMTLQLYRERSRPFFPPSPYLMWRQDLRLALTAVVGVVGGVVLVISWWRFGSIMACVLVVGLMLGFLLSSTIFFTPLGDLDVFHSDVAFWLTFSCITVTMPLLFIRWPREGNIITCGVVGAYAAVLAVSSYVNTSVSYITLNILKRLLNNNFNSTFTNVSFRDIDYVMITMWAVLGVTGMTLQLYRERSRPFFPPSPYLMWRQDCERRKTNVLDPSYHTPSLLSRVLLQFQQFTGHREPIEESTPLLL